MKTVIMAGGKGTRITSIAADIPKPMIKIDGMPVLERELRVVGGRPRLFFQRPVSDEYAKKLVEIDPERGPGLAKNLERSLMAILLVAHEALTTAYINDVDGLGVFA